MFGIELRKKDNIKNREKEINEEELFNDKNKYYIEINPKSEIVRVENKEQLKALNELEEVKALPNDELPPLKGEEVCAHWEREVIFLSEVNPELYFKNKIDIIIGGYCSDCGKDLGQPKLGWYPKISYKKK